MFEQALATGRDLVDDMLVGWALHNLGHVALHSGELALASARFKESRLFRWRLGAGADVAAGLAAMAAVALRGGQLAEAARLFGAGDACLESTQTVLSPADQLVRRADLDAIHSQLDDAVFETAFHEGQAAKFEDFESMANAVSSRLSGRGA